MFINRKNFYRTSIKALILDDKKRFLLTLEKNGLWEFPGGGLDFGEKPHACIKRELKEEVGIEATHIEESPHTLFQRLISMASGKQTFFTKLR